MIRVLGIDPGGTTGLAVLDYHHNKLVMHYFKQVKDPAEVQRIIRAYLSHTTVPVNVVAIERFVVNRRAGRSGSAAAGEKARTIIGAVTALCREAGVPLVTYSASQVKAWATDKRLEAAGLLAPTRGLPHARDATRHALHAAVWRCGLPDPLTTEERT